MTQPTPRPCHGPAVSCSAVNTVRLPGYEHLPVSEQPIRDEMCSQPATQRVRYGRVRWTLPVCDIHVARHTERGARVVSAQP